MRSFSLTGENLMKNHLAYLAVVLVLFSNCYRAKQPPPETPFFRDFSLAAVVEGMRIAELHAQEGGSGKSEAFGEPQRRRRNFDLTYLIDEQSATRFDHQQFIRQLDLAVEKLIGNAGLRVDGRSSSGDNFQLDYSQAGYSGSLDVAGTRAQGNQLKLYAVIREVAQEQNR